MSDIDDIEFKIARLELGPDDILVVRPLKVLSDAQVHFLKHLWRDGLQRQNKILVLEPGMELAALAPAPADDALVGKTDDELRVMFEAGEISRNEMRRAQGLRQLTDSEKPAAA